MNEWVRYVGMADCVIGFACVMWVDARTGSDLHRALTWTLRLLAVFPVGMFLGLFANIATHMPVTTGAYVVALLLTPVASMLLLLATRFTGSDDRLAQFLRVTDELEKAPPCETPECIRARRDLQRIANGEPR